MERIAPRLLVAAQGTGDDRDVLAASAWTSAARAVRGGGRGSACRAWRGSVRRRAGAGRLTRIMPNRAAGVNGSPVHPPNLKRPWRYRHGRPHQRKRRESVQHLQNLLGTPLRVPFPDLRPGAPRAAAPRCDTRSRPGGLAPRRYLQRPRKLTPAQVSAIRALAATRSLRSLAADFGVSHETVRAACRRG